MKSICDKFEFFFDFLILKNFSKFLEKFHFSISISRHFQFTFTLDLDIKAFSFHFSFAKIVHIFACIHFWVIISGGDNRPYQYIFRVFFRVFRVLFRVFFREKAIFRVFMVFQTPLAFMHLECGPKAGHCKETSVTSIKRVTYARYMRTKIKFNDFAKSCLYVA